eukprot:2165906-Rhodomonas_salina.1
MRPTVRAEPSPCTSKFLLAQHHCHCHPETPDVTAPCPLPGPSIMPLLPAPHPLLGGVHAVDVERERERCLGARALQSPSTPASFSTSKCGRLFLLTFRRVSPFHFSSAPPPPASPRSRLQAETRSSPSNPDTQCLSCTPECSHKVLGQCQVLAHLHMDRTDMNAVGAGRLAEVLLKECKPTALDLSGTRLDGEGPGRGGHSANWSAIPLGAGTRSEQLELKCWLCSRWGVKDTALCCLELGLDPSDHQGLRVGELAKACALARCWGRAGSRTLEHVMLQNSWVGFGGVGRLRAALSGRWVRGDSLELLLARGHFESFKEGSGKSLARDSSRAGGEGQPQASL